MRGGREGGGGDGGRSVDVRWRVAGYGPSLWEVAVGGLGGPMESVPWSWPMPLCRAAAAASILCCCGTHCAVTAGLLYLHNNSAARRTSLRHELTAVEWGAAAVCSVSALISVNCVPVVLCCAQCASVTGKSECGWF